jgi:hypothetical protein
VGLISIATIYKLSGEIVAVATIYRMYLKEVAVAISLQNFNVTGDRIDEAF